MTFNSVYLSGMVTRLCHIFLSNVPDRKEEKFISPYFGTRRNKSFEKESRLYYASEKCELWAMTKMTHRGRQQETKNSILAPFFEKLLSNKFLFLNFRGFFKKRFAAVKCNDTLFESQIKGETIVIDFLEQSEKKRRKRE